MTDIEDLARIVHRAIAPWYMSIATAMGSQEHYNEFLSAIASAVDGGGSRELMNETNDAGDVLDGAVRYAKSWKEEGNEYFGPKLMLDLISMTREAIDSRDANEEEWADYFESWGSAVGAPPFTSEAVVSALRGPRPFGAWAVS